MKYLWPTPIAEMLEFRLRLQAQGNGLQVNT